MGWKTKNNPDKPGEFGQHYQEQHGDRHLSKRAGLPANDRVAEPRERVLIQEMNDPHSGAPLEPSLAYGNTVAYSPHSGHFSTVVVPGGEPVEPRFAAAHRKSLIVAQSYTGQAAEKVRGSHSEADVKEAARMFEHAQRVEPWHQYPEADLQKDPVYLELKESNIMIQNDIQSARESKGAEKQKYLESARRRMLASDAALKEAQ